MATTPTPLVFSGNDNENPQNFLREVERYIQLTRITNEATKVILFSTFISAGSQADIWWGGLTAQQTALWAAIKAVFETQWPAIVVAAKSTLDYQKELLTLRLKEDDVGERITVVGISTWSHLHYHGCLQKLVQDAGVANAPVIIHRQGQKGEGEEREGESAELEARQAGEHADRPSRDPASANAVRNDRTSQQPLPHHHEYPTQTS
jgi:hypothetical protein